METQQLVPREIRAQFAQQPVSLLVALAREAHQAFAGGF